MIRLLLLAYPRTWRRRYGDELSQLVEETGLSPRVVLDLLAAGVAERRHSMKTSVLGGTLMFIGPAWRHPRGLALLALIVLAPILVFVLGSILAYQIGVVPLVGPLESVNSWLAARPIMDVFPVISVAVALLLALAPLVRFELRPGESGNEAVVGVRLRLANLAVGGLALVVGALVAWHVVLESLLEIRA